LGERGGEASNPQSRCRSVFSTPWSPQSLALTWFWWLELKITWGWWGRVGDGDESEKWPVNMVKDEREKLPRWKGIYTLKTWNVQTKSKIFGKPEVSGAKFGVSAPPETSEQICKEVDLQ
jgi:hypothetical protein